MVKDIYKQIGIKGLVLLLILFIAASGIGAIIFERLVLPQLQILPMFRDLKIFGSRFPIVITRREEIRIEGEVNTQEVISRVRGALIKGYVSEGKLSAGLSAEALAKAGKSATVVSGIAATNDGLLLIPSFAAKRGGNVTVVLESGVVSPGQVLFVDDLSGIAFVKISARDLPMLNEASHRDKKPGEHLLLLSLNEGPGIRVREVGLRSASVARPSLSKLHDLTVFDSALDLDPDVTEEDLGSVIVDKDGALVGFVSRIKERAAVLRVGDVQLVLDNFLGHQSLEVRWPQLRISYLLLGPVQAELLGLEKRIGILIRQGEKNLIPGDFVYAVDGKDITFEESFQQLIFAKKPADKVRLKLLRAGKDMEIEVSL